MKRFFVTFLAVIVAQIVLAVVFFGGLMMFATIVISQAGDAAKVPPRACLVQEIPAELLEHEPLKRIPIPRHMTTQTSILANLEHARADDRVEKVVLKLNAAAIGWGKMAEIRRRVTQLREAGKPVYAYVPFAVNRTLYLAAACDSIFIAPEGAIWFTGLMSERYYLKDMFEEVGIDVQYSKIDEYKAAVETYLRDDMSDAARENAEWILEDLYEQLVTTIAADRGVDRAEVEGWLEIAQFTPQEAVDAGLIDGALFWEDLEALLAGDGGEIEVIEGRDYAQIPRSSFGVRGPKIAVVHGQGMITLGESGWAFPFGLSMGDETMVTALEKVLEDDDIEGIMLRLDTPGGLSIASDRIGRMVARVAAEKPLVVSSVDLNASGGYMISYRSPTIVALPNSIVGSIGSFALRPNMAGLMDRLGVDFDRVTVGPHATLFSGVVSLSDEELQRFRAVHRRSYEEWIAGVAKHRQMTVERVDDLARGQVYTGRQALENGLIDALGGFDEALAMLKVQMGLAEDAPVTVLHYPQPKGLLEMMAEGDWPAAAAYVAGGVGLRTVEEEQLRESARFWMTYLKSRDALYVLPWKF
ncbi:MAG: S49 family peptidase [Candidatus Eisenbacteria sp.]|nr:S49 family peptidase [Candidatus Eisenbacteria bacterium]